MEIGAPGAAAPGASPARARPRAGAAGFALAPELPDAAETARAGGAAGIPLPMEVGLAAILALQESEAAAARDRQARRHGESLLTELAALQRALLSGVQGAGGDAALRQLAALTEQVPTAADPALAAIVSAIAVRARVALARLEAGR